MKPQIYDKNCLEEINAAAMNEVSKICFDLLPVVLYTISNAAESGKFNAVFERENTHDYRQHLHDISDVLKERGFQCEVKAEHQSPACTLFVTWEALSA